MSPEELQDAVEQNEEALALLQKEISKLKDLNGDLKNDVRLLVVQITRLRNLVLVTADGTVQHSALRDFGTLLQEMRQKYGISPTE